MKIKQPAKRVTVSTPAAQSIIYPKGFDITLQQIFNEYNVTSEDLEKLKAEHRKGGSLAYAFVGQHAFYRRNQIDQLLTKKSI